MKIQQKNCPDCTAVPGTPHQDGCDVERCSVCGRQHLSCGCEGHDKVFARWTGFWPGTLESQALGVDLNEFYLSGIYKLFFVKPGTSTTQLKLPKAPYVASISVMDPVSKKPIEVEIYRDPISGGMFGIDASFIERVTDIVVSPFNEPKKVKLADNKAKKPFKTAYVFGETDARLASEHKWKAMENDPCEFEFATLEEMTAFDEGVDETIGWLECQGLDANELKACKKARKR